jgi:hypothetical protein
MRRVNKRVDLKSPVLENCTPGSVRGALGNWRPYLANMDINTAVPNGIFIVLAGVSSTTIIRRVLSKVRIAA